MVLEKFFDNFIVEIGKYTAIPAIIAFLVKIPSYDERIVFAILTILNWIVLTEFRMRDISKQLKYRSKGRK
mgnify:CR=1 FL=1